MNERIQPPPIITTPLTTEELATALARIQQISRERDDFASRLSTEQSAHHRTKDRLQLVQNQLEKTEEARDMFMRTAAAYAELINNIGLLADKAKEAVRAAIHDGLLKGETKEEKHETTIIANRFAPVPHNTGGENHTMQELTNDR